MDDEEILGRIHGLVEEEHKLENQHTAGGLQGAEADRYGELQVQLDQLWDLLRQRRARRHAGKDPDSAEPRPGWTVEGYSQ